MTFNLCFNFKLNECISVFGYCIRGVIDCNEWKTEKGRECTNIGEVKDPNYDGNCTSCDFQFGT